MLVFLDVDGPLNPFAAEEKPPGFVEHRFRLRGWSRKHPLRMWLNPGHGAALLDAGPAQLVWATTWNHQANTLVGPAIGLPPLAVVDCADTGASWKYGPVAAFAGRRPLVWLDDDFDVYPAAREEFLAGREGVVTELIAVDPRRGMGEEHLAVLRECLRG
ncbi:hypothetical protein JOD54_006159 [Actinokineospora baliensis]|uniref:hypothetical protein n=1 Tax=Actinokineospora baliensis TaxID=547056 RepID=UPI00195F097A|nr:hypothetical protein [Actinokineospora baliensis]MBM7775955.1 hypothetical protein [Actinokineospora baliensis]